MIGINGFIVMYDITTKESFRAVKYWMDLIEEANADKSSKIVLVGHKIDKCDDREVCEEEGEKLAKKYNIAFFESSSRLNINVREVFDYLVEEFMKIEIKKNMNQYLIARKNLEMLYQQEEEKNEKEGRRSRTRNSHSQNEL